MKTIYFGGAGMAWWFHIGYMEYIKKHYSLPKLNYAGVSSGSFVASIYGLDLDINQVKELYKSIFNAKLKNKWTHFGIIYHGVLPFMRSLFKESKYDINKINNIHIRLTNTSFQTWFINSFDDMEDMIQCIFLSGYIPFFIAGTFSHSYKAHNFIDGYYIDNLSPSTDCYVIETNTTIFDTYTYKTDYDINNLITKGYLQAYCDKHKLDKFFGVPIISHDKDVIKCRL